MLKIPTSKAEIEQPELIAYATLSTNDLVLWRLKRLISNIAIAGFWILTKIESKEQYIQNMQSQEDIEKIFEEQTTEACQMAERKKDAEKMEEMEAEQRVKKIEKHIEELAGNTNVEREEEIGEDLGSPEPFGGAEVDTTLTLVIPDTFVD
ncbi:hypothetical protein HOY80DRAFT_1041010 [Tuber brumale]|nr:hypothetical protein HOY80DRAFT_1041010 [Tuber brumale]